MIQFSGSAIKQCEAGQANTEYIKGAKELLNETLSELVIPYPNTESSEISISDQFSSWMNDFTDLFAWYVIAQLIVVEAFFSYRPKNCKIGIAGREIVIITNVKQLKNFIRILLVFLSYDLQLLLHLLISCCCSKMSRLLGVLLQVTQNSIMSLSVEFRGHRWYNQETAQLLRWAAQGDSKALYWVGKAR